MRHSVYALLAVSVALVGCDKKKDEAPLAPSATALEVSKAAPSAMTVHFDVQKDGKTSIDMPGVKEHIKADTTASAGSLDVDLMDLTKSVGEVKVDLTTLSTHTFDDKDKNDSQTGHARNWMEVGSDYAKDAIEKNRWAVFAIRSIDGVSEPNVWKVAPVAKDAEDVRTVALTGHGEILIHGHAAKKDIPMEARFYWPAGATQGTKPTRIVFATKSPLHVTLKEHDVRPRDTSGKLLDWTTSLISKVAETADISFELTAKPTA
jgi:hypothetical protein